MSIIWKRTSPISEDGICKGEMELGTTIPTELKAIVMKYNNGRPLPNRFDSPREKEHVIKKLLSFKKEDVENVYNAKRVVEETDSSLIPFANDPAGNLICLKGEKVVYWLHETNEIEEIATSLTVFLNNLY